MYDEPLPGHSFPIAISAEQAQHPLGLWQGWINGADITGSTDSARIDVIGNPYDNIPPGRYFNPAAFALPTKATLAMREPTLFPASMIGIPSTTNNVWVSRPPFM